LLFSETHFFFHLFLQPEPLLPAKSDYFLHASQAIYSLHSSLFCTICTSGTNSPEEIEILHKRQKIPSLWQMCADDWMGKLHALQKMRGQANRRRLVPPMKGLSDFAE